MTTNIDLKFFDQCKNYIVHQHERNLPYTRGYREGRPLHSHSEYLEFQHCDINKENFESVKDKLESHLKTKDPNLTYGVFRVSVEKRDVGYEIAVGYYYF